MFIGLTFDCIKPPNFIRHKVNKLSDGQLLVTQGERKRNQCFVSISHYIA